MLCRRNIAAIATLFLMLLSATGTSGDAPTLKDIMQGLRDDLVRISDGLLTDDFELIASAAQGIAEHPRIPAHQVALVATELGAEMSSFKQLDTRVHELSLQIREAAGRSDRDTAFRGYQQMVEGCIACHDSYKTRVARVLGGTGP